MNLNDIPLSDEDKQKGVLGASATMLAYLNQRETFDKKIDKALWNQKIMLRCLTVLLFIAVSIGFFLIIKSPIEKEKFRKEKELFVRLKVVQDSSNTAREQANIKMMANIFKQDSLAKLKNVIKANVVNAGTVNTVNARSVNVKPKPKQKPKK